jgi:hypothetical protein
MQPEITTLSSLVLTRDAAWLRYGFLLPHANAYLHATQKTLHCAIWRCRAYQIAPARRRSQRNRSIPRLFALRVSGQVLTAMKYCNQYQLGNTAYMLVAISFPVLAVVYYVYMKEQVGIIFRKDKWLYAIAVILFAAISIWYICIHSFDISTTEKLRQLWGSAYQVMAIFGCLIGFIASNKWDGHTSLIGRAIMFFSIGLLLQSFGQSVDSYYNFFEHQAIPYPSLGDIGFMGSVIAYIAGAVTVLKATGFQFSVKSVQKRLIAIVVPLIVLIACYLFFLHGYVFDWSYKVKILLDLAYPLGQAVYVSIVLIAYLTSRNYNLGAMKWPLFSLFIALAAQYLADFTFLYQANAGTWYVGGMNDFLYFLSYTLMALSLLVMGGVRRVLLEM